MWDVSWSCKTWGKYQMFSKFLKIQKNKIQDLGQVGLKYKKIDIYPFGNLLNSITIHYYGLF